MGWKNIIIIRNRIIMSNYYYAPQQALLKQSSQVLASLPLHQAQHALVRSTLTERSNGQSKNAYLPPPLHLIHPHITRETSVPHLPEPQTLKQQQPHSLQGRNVNNENQRVFSDYQITVAGRTEEPQLSSPAAYSHIANKIGEKIKSKTEMHTSRNTLSPNDTNPQPKVPSIRIMESITDNDKDAGRNETVLEQLNIEVAKLTERLSQQEERIDCLQRSRKEESSGSIFACAQMQEINKILSVVEKAEQRDDYKRAIRMIEELRTNILELHAEVKQIQTACIQPLPKCLTPDAAQDIISASLQQTHAQMRKIIQSELAEVKQRFSKVESEWAERRQREAEDGSGVVSSIKRFEGTITTLLYEERITCQAQISLKSPSKSDSSDKENNNVLLTTKTYYLDSSGYLLDKNKFYLLNSSNQQIRLTERQIALLKKHAIL